MSTQKNEPNLIASLQSHFSKQLSIHQFLNDRAVFTTWLNWYLHTLAASANLSIVS